MKRALFAFFIYSAMASPVAAYAPSGKHQYNVLEISLVLATLNCRMIADLGQQFACLLSVDQYRRMGRVHISPAQARQLLETARRVLGR